MAKRIADMYKEFSDGIHGRMTLDMTKAQLIIGRPLSKDQKCIIIIMRISSVRRQPPTMLTIQNKYQS
jgi:hypothetical protein